MMIAIPLTIIGIMPGFWLLNLSADAGRRLRHPGLLHRHRDDRHDCPGRHRRAQLDHPDRLHRAHPRPGDATLAEALIEAGAMRLRPIFLTAGAAMFGAFVIILDPIFSGLAWSFIFGIFASTLFSLLVIPVVYFLINKEE